MQNHYGLFLAVLLAGSLALGCSHRLNKGYDPWHGVLDPTEVFSDDEVVALTSAAQAGKIGEIVRLAESGVDVNARGRGNITPLMCVFTARNKAGFRRLLELGADPNVQMDNGLGVMCYAASAKDDSEWLQLCLRHGGDLNMIYSKNAFCPKYTPIYSAINEHHVEGARLLIEASADLTHEDSEGQTPLGFAVAFRHFDIAYLLLKAGADHRGGFVFGESILAVTREYLDGSKLTEVEQIPWAAKCLEIMEERERERTEEEQSRPSD